jgi:hypothetical protein
MRIHFAVLRGAACLVPGEQRAEWLAEWRAELWYVRQGGGRQATAFCLGSFRDALWLRRNRPPDAPRPLRLESPARCLGFLGLVAAVCVAVALGHRRPDFALPVEGPILAMVYMAMMSLPVLPASTSLRFGECPANRSGWRWVFLAAKIALLLPIVFLGTLDVAKFFGVPIHAGPLHCMMVAYAVAFRWALVDQRRRCPECLRLLKHPVPIGQPSQTFLAWYGTEFVCEKGHGLLHVPEIPTVSFRTERWQHLDRSWTSLFSQTGN